MYSTYSYTGQECHMADLFTSRSCCPRRDAEACTVPGSRSLAERAREGDCAGQGSSIHRAPAAPLTVHAHCSSFQERHGQSKFGAGVVGIRAGRSAFMTGKEIPSFPQRRVTLILAGQSTKPCTARVSTRSQRSLDDRCAVCDHR